MKLIQLIKPALVLSVLMLAGLTSCNKKGCTDPEADNYNEKSKKDDGSCTYDNYTADFTAFFAANREAATQTFTVNGATGGTINATGGTIIQVPSGAFVDGGGAPVTGTVTVKVLEILDKSDMIWMGVATEAGDEDLITGGELKVTATSGGSAVFLASGASLDVYVPYTTYDSSMGLFDGAESAAGDVTWTEMDSTVLDSIPDSTGTSGWYYFPWTDADFGWINCDYFWDYAGPMSSLTANLSGEYHWMNTTVYLYYADYSSVGYMNYLYGDSDENTYLETGVPNGSLTVIAISEIAGTYYSSFTPVSLSADVTVDLDMTETTLADIAAAIDAL